jgi:large subunit ribosomal protein L24e
MVERRLCSFCGGNVEPGTGSLFVKRDGSTFYFCRSKCSRNLLDLRRNPRRVRWTVHHLRERGVEAKREAVGVGVLKRTKAPPAPAKPAAKPPAKPAVKPAEKKTEPAKK